MGYEVECYSDHKSLTPLHFKDPRGIWSRWLLDLVLFAPRMKVISGIDNVVADAMARLHESEERLAVSLGAVEIVDEEEKKRIIMEYHGAYGGHFSVRKTVLNIRQKYNWKNIYADVERFCDPPRKLEGGETGSDCDTVIEGRTL